MSSGRKVQTLVNVLRLADSTPLTSTHGQTQESQMPKRTHLIAVLGAVVLTVGLVGWWASLPKWPPGFEEATSLTLYSIDGGPRIPPAPAPDGPTFHGYPILGKVEVNE